MRTKFDILLQCALFRIYTQVDSTLHYVQYRYMHSVFQVLENGCEALTSHLPHLQLVVGISASRVKNRQLICQHFTGHCKNLKCKNHGLVTMNRLLGCAESAVLFAGNLIRLLLYVVVLTTDDHVI